MRNFIIAMAALALSSVASATVVCSNFTLAQSCNYGSVSFNNFTVVGTNSNVGDTNTTVTNNLRYSIDYTNGVYTVTSTYAGATLTTGQQTAFNLQYLVSEIGAADFKNVSLTQTSAFTGFGSNQIAKNVCSAQQNTTGTCVAPPATSYTIPNLATIDAQPSTGFVNFNGGAKLGSFWVNDNVQIAGSIGTATLTSFANAFTVPEPMSLSLMGAGLLAVGLIGRRVRR